MTKIFIRSVKDYNKGVGEKAIVGNELVIQSQNTKMLESLKEIIETIFVRCEICKGEVSKSDEGTYLCLSGCGHVKGEVTS